MGSGDCRNYCSCYAVYPSSANGWVVRCCFANSTCSSCNCRVGVDIGVPDYTTEAEIHSFRKKKTEKNGRPLLLRLVVRMDEYVLDHWSCFSRSMHLGLSFQSISDTRIACTISDFSESFCRKFCSQSFKK